MRGVPSHAAGRSPGREPGTPRIGGVSLGMTLVISGEAALLGLLLLGAPPVAAAAVALGALYLLLAFRAPEVAWSLTFVSMPFSVEVVLPGGVATYLPTEPMIVLALAGWTGRLLSAGRFRLRPSPLHVPLAVTAVLALDSIVWGRFHAAGLKAWLVAAVYAGFGYLYFASTACGEGRRDRWVGLVSAVGAGWGLYGAIRVAVLGASLQTAYGAARPFFTEHGTYGAFLCLLLPIPLFEALERRGAVRAAFAAAFVAIFLGAALSFTRASWLSLLLVLPIAVIAWMARKRTWRALVMPVSLTAAAVLLVVSLGVAARLARHAETVVETENVSNLERVNRWMAAWEMTRDHPWTGVGYGAYAAEYPAYRRKAIVTELAYHHMGAHSEAFRLLSEMGWPGLFAGLWLLGAAGTAGWRTFHRARDPKVARLALAVTAGLATYAIHGLFNSYLGIDKVTLPFWMGLGVLAALSGATDHGSEVRA